MLSALMSLMVALLADSAAAQEVRHLYDSKGQLIAVIDVDGSAATFSWDEASNLVGISRTDASSIAGPVGITLVSPNQGKPGDPIEIFGKGLANPTSVTFYNGVAATVQASTSTSIKASVPAGATTGLLHVVTPLGQADSPSNFTVLSTTPLTITPANAAVLPTRTVQFAASEPVTWSADSIPNGNAQVGTISGAGLYTAPGTGPFPRQLTVGAQSTADPQRRAEAVVTIEPAPVTRAPRVTVLTPAPGPTQAQPLTAPRVTVERGPVITAVSPSSVAQGATNVVLVLTGQSLGTPTALQFLLNGSGDGTITYSGLTANAPGTRATATLTVGGSATLGGRVAQITAGGVSSTPLGTGTNVFQVSTAPTSWWNTAYHYRKPLTVTTGPDALEADYSVKLVFDHAALVSVGKALSNGNDARLTYWNGTSEVPLDRVLGSGSGWNRVNTTLWFKLPAAVAAYGTDANYFVYYGNTAPGSPPANADNVYPLYDAFSSGTLNASKWTAVTSGAVTVAPTGGFLKVSGTTDATNATQTFGIRSVATLPGNVAIESTFRVFSQSATAHQHWKGAFGLGLESTGLGVNSTASTNKRVQYWDGAAWVDLGDSTMDTQTFSNKTVRQTLLLDGTAKHSEAGVLKATRTGVSTAARTLVFQYGPDQPNETFEVRFDTIIVRKYVASDGAIASSLGQEVAR